MAGTRRTLGPWPGGFINAIPPEYVLERTSKEGPAGLTAAVNVDINRVGEAVTRDGWSSIDDAPASSIYEVGDRTFGVVGGFVGELFDGGFTAWLPAAYASWTMAEDILFFATESAVYRADPNTGSALQLPFSPAPKGDSRLLTRMPGGRFLSYWKGRLVLARGTSIYFSEPMNYGSCDQLRGVYPSGVAIQWMTVLETGIYFASRETVFFLKGSSPLNLERSTVYNRSWRGAAISIPTTDMDPELVGGVEEVAVWIGERGFVIGTPSGAVKAVQAARIDNLPIRTGRMSYSKGRVVVIEV